MEKQILLEQWERTIIGLAKLAYREHRINDDCWYSCPASGESCNGERMDETGDACTCGADTHNLIVKSVFYDCYQEHGYCEDAMVIIESRWQMVIA